MDIRLMLTILKPAFSISARMAPVCPLRTASGLTMLKVRWLKTLSWREICAISSVQAGGEFPPGLVQPSNADGIVDAMDLVCRLRGVVSRQRRQHPCARRAACQAGDDGGRRIPRCRAVLSGAEAVTALHSNQDSWRQIPSKTKHRSSATALANLPLKSGKSSLSP